METNYQVFLQSVRESFHHWPILRIAKQQGFGGQHAAEKEQWLCDSVVQIFSDNDLVHADELQDFISEALFNEFDTIAEDGSLPELSERLCRFYGLCKASNCEPVVEAIRKMAAASSQATNVQKVDNLSDDDDDDDDDLLAHNNSGSNGHNQSGYTEAMDTEEREPQVDADGWEVVRRSKKK